MKLQENLTAVYNKSLNNLWGERWKEIPYTEGYYLISNYGRVKITAQVRRGFYS